MSGTVLQAIRAQYKLVPGTGSENPASYAMIIFDGRGTTPAQLQDNPGVKDFLAAGKAVVVLHNTPALRSTGLKGAVWAHAEGSAPATAWLYLRPKDPKTGDRITGEQKHLEQIDFPLRILAPLPGSSSAPTLLAPTVAQLKQDSQQWLDAVQQALAGSSGYITPSACGAKATADCASQSVKSFFDSQSLDITVPLIINGQSPPYATNWTNKPQQAKYSTTTITGTFETRAYALLEGSAAGGYQHKIIARQYLNVSPPTAPPGQSWSSANTHQITSEQPIVGSCDLWTTLWPVYATLGWNDAVTLGTTLENVPKNIPLTVPAFNPQVANNTTTLTTSESHTETVGVSATAGIQGGNPTGLLTASWSSSWMWDHAHTISIQDWEVRTASLSDDNRMATYEYDASGNSAITDSILQSHLLILPLGTNPASNNQLTFVPFHDLLEYVGPNMEPIPPSLNGLQTNALVTKSETVWAPAIGTVAPNNNALFPPQTIKLISTANITSGEVMDLVGAGGPGLVVDDCSSLYAGLVGFTAGITTPEKQTIDLDFANPALQPPDWNATTNSQLAAPPWTLSFPPWPTTITQNQKLTGTVTVPQATLNLLSKAKPGQGFLLTYVVAPQSTILAPPPPAPPPCPGNEFTYNPGAVAVSNGSPPLQMPWSAFTCHSGTCSAPVSLSFETANTNQYDVQVVAWLPQMTTVGGDTVIGPQSAWCLDVPEITQ